MPGVLILGAGIDLVDLSGRRLHFWNSQLQNHFFLCLKHGKWMNSVKVIIFLNKYAFLETWCFRPLRSGILDLICTRSTSCATKRNSIQKYMFKYGRKQSQKLCQILSVPLSSWRIPKTDRHFQPRLSQGLGKIKSICNSGQKWEEKNDVFKPVSQSQDHCKPNDPGALTLTPRALF